MSVDFGWLGYRGERRYRRAAVLAVMWGGAWLSLPSFALAHAGDPLAPHDLVATWTWEPLVLAGIPAIDLVYWLGLYRLWCRAGLGRGVQVGQAAAFAGGCIALLIALASPLDTLSGVLLSAHMLQHMVLILAAAPLLALSGLPFTVLWALPRDWRRRIGVRWRRSQVARPAWRVLAQPFVAWTLATGSLWLWHLPGLYQAALTDEWVHGLEHMMFLGTSVLFWWVLVNPARRGAARYGVGVLYVFTSALQAGALGALMTFANQTLYPAYADSAAAWGTTPLADQQLAGLVMWLPGGILYTAIAAGLFMAWLKAVEHEMLCREGRVATAPTVGALHE